MKHVWGFVLTLGLSASPALASEDVVREPDRVGYQKKTVISFSEIQLSGEIVKPSTTLVWGRRRAGFKSLIRTRGDFRPELLASVDAL